MWNNKTRAEYKSEQAKDAGWLAKFYPDGPAWMTEALENCNTDRAESNKGYEMHRHRMMAGARKGREFTDAKWFTRYYRGAL